MTAIVFSALITLLQEAPELVNLANVLSQANDITQEQLDSIIGSEHAAVAKLAADVAAAKAAGQQ